MKEINIYFSKENNAMKKLIFKILPAVILLAGAFIVLSGCEEEKQMKVIYPAVNLPMSVVTFFEKTLSNTDSANCLFKSEWKDTCFLINSKEEFESILLCNKELPAIDFSLYSVIVGKKNMPNSFYSIVEQSINNDQTLELNIIVHLPNEHWPAFSDMFYWALYPKLPNKKISINIIERT